jgi:hypothetical protein
MAVRLVRRGIFKEANRRLADKIATEIEKAVDPRLEVSQYKPPTPASSCSSVDIPWRMQLDRCKLSSSVIYLNLILQSDPTLPDSAVARIALGGLLSYVELSRSLS